jgi:hypothetical protein
LQDYLKMGTVTSTTLSEIVSGRSAIGSALVLGARGCQFESGRPDQTSPFQSTYKKLILHNQ